MSEGKKFDNGKLDWQLLRAGMPYALEAIIRVLMFGAAKYDRNNWQLVENGELRYRNALDRHLAAIDKGEVYDEETGQPHLAHVATNALFLLEKQCYGTQEFKVPMPPQLSGLVAHGYGRQKGAGPVDETPADYLGYKLWDPEGKQPDEYPPGVEADTLVYVRLRDDTGPTVARPAGYFRWNAADPRFSGGVDIVGYRVVDETPVDHWGFKVWNPEGKGPKEYPPGVEADTPVYVRFRNGHHTNTAEKAGYCCWNAAPAGPSAELDIVGYKVVSE